MTLQFKRFFLFVLLFMGVFVEGLLAQNQQGKASYYHKNLSGKKTYSGERYNAYLFTAAHRKYPMGTWLEITHIQSGIKSYVRVNDRGPHHKRLLIDVSFSAAKELGIVGAGIAPVLIRPLEETDLRDTLLTFLQKRDSLILQEHPYTVYVKKAKKKKKSKKKKKR
ncbi:septal ring lytic transglycosylase RlpA family protein [Cytophagaceae bacterium 50C-KIRBA]|uniref:Probable endolytic peptidoglycan transglycosylase RlpA n=1 Tax=Aquirufa beregesia TaxID=2516556 RepID=A0ABX0ERA6_9BACT|nr:septal ring lytic transglycosylase RlpA family protein [Aquirufa beregesia]NGZ42881.1 septal ring lytic transglycosylase RlpA family protein [Aquirufa beregesia]